MNRIVERMLIMLSFDST
ncbi:hypothetical protein Tsp_05889, partial [Trichinella spiralis]